MSYPKQNYAGGYEQPPPYPGSGPVGGGQGYYPGPGQGQPPPPGFYIDPSQTGYAGYGPPPGGHQAAFNASNTPLAQPGYRPKPNEDMENGGVTGFDASTFTDKSIRRMFIRKVYLTLFAQMAFTMGVIAVFLFVDEVKMFVKRNSWVYWCSYGVFLVTYIALVCCPSVRRKSPTNIIMLCIFTAALSYMTGTISSYYDVNIVLIAVGITAGVCLLVTFAAIQTKIDITGSGMYLFVASIILFIFGIVCIFTYNRIMYTIYAAGIALLFSIYLAYDTQQIMGGRKIEISPEENIYASIQLYLDVIQIFWAVLALTGMASGD